MNFKNHFNTEDIPAAQAEWKCVLHLMELAAKYVEASEFKKANERLVEVMRSIKRMEELFLKKHPLNSFKEEFRAQLNNHMAERLIREQFNAE